MKNKTLHTNLLRHLIVYGEMNNIEPFQYFAVEIGLGGNNPDQSLRNKFSIDDKKLTDEQLEKLVEALCSQKATKTDMTAEDIANEALRISGVVGTLMQCVCDAVGDKIVDAKEVKQLKKLTAKASAVLSKFWFNLDHFQANL